MRGFAAEEKSNIRSRSTSNLRDLSFLRCFYHYAEILFLSEEEKHAKEIFLKSQLLLGFYASWNEGNRGQKGGREKKLVSNIFLFDEGSNVRFLISNLEKSAHDSTHLRVKNMYLYLDEFISLSRIFLPTDLRISKYFFFEI